MLVKCLDVKLPGFLSASIPGSFSRTKDFSIDKKHIFEREHSDNKWSEKHN